MNIQPKIIIVDHEQHYAEPLTKLLADQYNLNMHIEFAEDKEALLSMVNAQTIAILFKAATDYEYTFAFTFLNSQKLTTPLIYLTDNVGLLTDNAQTRPLLEIYSAGVAQVIFYKSYAAIAAIIAQITQLQAMAAKNSELKKQTEIAKNRALELQSVSEAAFCLIIDGIIVQSNEYFSQPFGLHSPADMIGSPIIDFIDDKDHSKFKSLLKACSKTNAKTEAKIIQCQDIQNHAFAAVLHIVPAEFEGESCIQITLNLEEKTTAPHEATASNAYDQQEARLYAHMQSASLDHQYHLILLLLNQFNVPKQLDLYDQYLVDITQKIAHVFHNQAIFQIRQNIFAIFAMNSTAVQIEQNCSQIKNYVHSNFPIFTRMDCTYREFIGQSDTLFVNDILMQINHAALAAETTPILDTPLMAQAEAQKLDMGSQKTLADLAPADPATITLNDSAILSAINSNQFLLEYQHIYDTIDDEQQFFELFLRLKLDNGEIYQPRDFFELAVTNQLTTNIDKWVLTSACKELKKYQAHYPHTHILINMETVSLATPTIEQILEKVSGLLGGEFMKTITLQFEAEQLMQTDASHFENLRAIQKFGCLISLKNFSNTREQVQFVQQHHIGLVKFAKQTIGDLSEDRQSESIKHIVQSLQTLGIKSLISFIDTPSTAARSWTLGARYIQGFFLHTPREQMEPHTDA